MPELTNLREFVGWAIGQKVIDITGGDPPEIPDADEEDSDFLILHFENGGTLEIPVDPEGGFKYFNPDEEDDDDDSEEEADE